MTISSSDDLLQITRDARGVVTFTLNDPQRFNALGAECRACSSAVASTALALCPKYSSAKSQK